MSKGLKTQWLYGHVETNSSSPQGSASYIDSRDPKRKARAAELMSQLKGSGYEERATKIQSLAERGNELSRSMHLNLAGTQKLMYGSAPAPSSPPLSPLSPIAYSRGGRGSRSRRAPWEPDSDSESDDGRRDTAHLTLDGKEVVQKEYKLINGHWALITYRKQLHEVDPYLLLKLREKRERELEKWEAKEERKKKKGKGREVEIEQNARPRISTPLAQLTGMRAPGSATKQTITMSSSQRREKRAEKMKLLRDFKERFHEERLETETPAPSPSLPVVDAESQEEISRWRQLSKDVPETGKTHVRKGKSSKSSSSSSSSSSSPSSFKARAAQNGFHPTAQRNSSHLIDNQEDLDIWQRIADEDNGKTAVRKGKYNLTPGRSPNKR
ncbi:hypothetical protein F5Y12DRAFT_20494 [Xylaria sp. FL1777]|nr:hypothetical protein F5Y12DRAFT_20494 [Xylaria sp. FL1777]